MSFAFFFTLLIHLAFSIFSYCFINRTILLKAMLNHLSAVTQKFIIFREGNKITHSVQSHNGDRRDIRCLKLLSN